MRTVICNCEALAVPLEDGHGSKARRGVTERIYYRSSLNGLKCSIHVEVYTLGRHCRCAGACSRGNSIFVAHKRLRMEFERLAHEFGNSTFIVSIKPLPIPGISLTPRRPPRQACYPTVERQSSSTLSYTHQPTHRRTGFEPCCTWPVLPLSLPPRHVLVGKATD